MFLIVAGLMPAATTWGYEVSDQFEINALIEVEAFDTDDAEGDFSGEDASDIEVATVEVALEARPTDRLSGHVLLLYEEAEGDEVVVDEATVSLALTEGLGLTAGKEYVPFGKFETLVVTDPLTLELGETNETVLQLDFGTGGWSGAVYGFSGDTTDAGGDSIEGIGAGFDYVNETESSSWAFGAGIISNLADSDSLQELEAGGEPGALDDGVPGLGVHLLATFGQWTFIAEHLRALDDFAAGDLGGAVDAGSQPSATNLEAGVDLGGGWSLGAAFRRTDEARFAGLPETMIAGAVGFQITDEVGVAVEVNKREDYSTGKGGTGEDSTTILAQLAAEF